MKSNLTRVAAGLLVFGHALVLLFAAFLFPSPDDSELALACLVGVVDGETVLLAVWLVFSQRRLVVRLLVSVLGVILVCAAASAYVVRTHGPGEVCVVWTAVSFGLWMATQIPFWLTKSTGWVIAKTDSSGSLGQHTRQFHLRHLFVWTTAIAVLCGVGNAVSGWIGDIDNGFPRWNDYARWIGFFGIIAATNVLMVGPFVWAILTRDGRYRWGLVACLSFVLLTPMEASLFRALSVSQMLLNESVLFIVVLSSIYVATIVTALLVARGFRWRLVKVAV